MIDILVPVLGRPHRAAPLVQNIRDTTTVDHRILFICTPADNDQIEACRSTDADTMVMTHAAIKGDYAWKINRGFKNTDNEWVLQAADDLTFQTNWAEAALKMADSGPGYDVVATNDLANGSVKKGLFGTHNLVRRRYVTEQQAGVVLHEGYDHNFVDREICGWAQHRGVYVFARHSHVKHSHPLWKTADDDPTYRKSLKRYGKDQKLFYKRAHLWGYHGLSAHERKMAA